MRKEDLDFENEQRFWGILSLHTLSQLDIDLYLYNDPYGIEVLLMRLEGFSFKEIGEKRGVGGSTISQKFHQMERKLRSAMSRVERDFNSREIGTPTDFLGRPRNDFLRHLAQLYIKSIKKIIPL